MEEDAEEFISKTQRKREMHALQDMGEELVALSESRLAELDLPERLRNAVLEAKRINKFGALRRQMQFIGKLMRDVDPEPITAKLDAWKGHSREATAYLHQLERWRARLIEGDDGIEAFVKIYPDCDLQRIRALVRNARREQSDGRAPTNFRELFQALKDVIPAPDATRASGADIDSASTSE